MSMKNILYLLMIFTCVNMQDEEEISIPSIMDIDAEISTVLWEYADETTKPDLSVDEILNAANLDVGVFTPRDFEYEKRQFVKWGWNKNDVCFEDYVKCMLTLTISHPVCTVRNYQDVHAEGYKTFKNICEFHFETCWRGYRFWRTLGLGICISYTYVDRIPDPTQYFGYRTIRQWQFYLHPDVATQRSYVGEFANMFKWWGNEDDW